MVNQVRSGASSATADPLLLGGVLAICDRWTGVRRLDSSLVEPNGKQTVLLPERRSTVSGSRLFRRSALEGGEAGFALLQSLAVGCRCIHLSPAGGLEVDRLASLQVELSHHFGQGLAVDDRAVDRLDGTGRDRRDVGAAWGNGNHHLGSANAGCYGGRRWEN